MATTTMIAKPAREAGYEMAQYIAARVTAVTAATGVTVEVGTLPVGSVILWVHSKVVTAFTGGTPLLTFGAFGDPGIDNLVAAVAETAGSELLQPLGTITQPLTADLRVQAFLTGGATAGDSYVCVGFYKPIA